MISARSTRNHRPRFPREFDFGKRRINVKTLLAKAALAAAALLLVLPSSAKAQDGKNNGCSLATLHGDYGFTISGQITGGPAPGPVNGVALTTFDGHGGLIQTDFVVKNGAPAGPLDAFRTGENGTYSVNSDCTGAATIHFPDVTPPQEIVLMFVIVNHGRGIRTVVAALYVGPGIATMTPTPAQITSEATKIEPEDHK
jgi:hypothetical protein